MFSRTSVCLFEKTYFQVKVWVLSLGFTLAFGSMFSKTWRVHSIFTNICMNKKAIKDYKLFLIVGFFVLIDVFTLVLWALFSPYSIATTRLDPYVSFLFCFSAFLFLFFFVGQFTGLFETLVMLRKNKQN